MNEQLKIDEEFRTIIPPLTEDEYTNLERSLRTEGCRDAIRVWDNVIVDGHNRYEICQRWAIPFQVVRLTFTSREEAISWICLNQLSRRNLTREAYKYLIGKRYDAEKIACCNRNNSGQFLPIGHRITERNEQVIAKRTSRKLAGEYHLSHATIERYGEYSRSLDRIEKEKPGVLPSLLSGKYRISHRNLTFLSKLPGEAIGTVIEKIQSAEDENQHVPMTMIAETINPPAEEPPPAKKNHLDTKIKEMPEYNPDAELNGLAITIPTWINMIGRLNGPPARYASAEAKAKMLNALNELRQAIARLQKEVEEAP